MGSRGIYVSASNNSSRLMYAVLVMIMKHVAVSNKHGQGVTTLTWSSTNKNCCIPLKTQQHFYYIYYLNLTVV